MKYRELTPNEIEAYEIGYKVGNRQIVITDIEWESENEHKIYRKGYMAGLMDYKRNVSNVSNVSNVDIITPITPITSTTPIGISIRNSIENKEIGGMGEKGKEPVSTNKKPRQARKQIEIPDYGQYESLRPQITKWLNYKKSRGESYKTEQSIMIFAKKLFTMSNGKPDAATQIIEQSMANNWAGIFELKTQPKQQDTDGFYGI